MNRKIIAVLFLVTGKNGTYAESNLIIRCISMSW